METWFCLFWFDLIILQTSFLSLETLWRDASHPLGGCIEALCSLQIATKQPKSILVRSNLVCLSELHFHWTDTCWFLFLEISYLWNTFSLSFSQFPFQFLFPKLFSQFLFPNKPASKPKRIKHKPRATSKQQLSPLCTTSQPCLLKSWG